MVTTPTERVLYASKSRKWNSTLSPKFPTEFPDEHAANLEWIKKTEQEAVQRENGLQMAEQAVSAGGQQIHGGRARKDNRGKWIVAGIIGILIALRGWQRFREI